MPFAASRVASVVMNGKRRNRVTIKPLMKPTTKPAAVPAIRPCHGPYGETSAATTLPSAATAPTERSMPPVMITNAIPSDTRANMEL